MGWQNRSVRVQTWCCQLRALLHSSSLSSGQASSQTWKIVIQLQLVYCSWSLISAEGETESKRQLELQPLQQQGQQTSLMVRKPNNEKFQNLRAKSQHCFTPSQPLKGVCDRHGQRTKRKHQLNAHQYCQIHQCATLADQREAIGFPSIRKNWREEIK